MFPSGRSRESFSTGYAKMTMSIEGINKRVVFTLAREMHKKHTDMSIPVTVTW